MKPLFVAALATTLAGCSLTSQQAWLRECTEANGLACSDEAISTAQTDSKPLVSHGGASTAKKAEARHGSRANTHTNNTDVLSADKKPNTAVTGKSIAAKTETRQSSQFDDNSDPVEEKAKVTIAAKMPNPAAVEFIEMTRAARKNALGNPVDTICGYVLGKNASGADIGERPFLYIVKEDEAYVGGYTIATSPYHNICNKKAAGRGYFTARGSDRSDKIARDVKWSA
jgi:hypothetical protein